MRFLKCSRLALSGVPSTRCPLLVGPIKADFQLNDTQMGLLLGLAFTVIHVLLAIPLGRTVDRHNRRNLILICGLLWSMCSNAAGFSRTDRKSTRMNSRHYSATTSDV